MAWDIAFGLLEDTEVAQAPFGQKRPLGAREAADGILSALGKEHAEPRVCAASQTVRQRHVEEHIAADLKALRHRRHRASGAHLGAELGPEQQGAVRQHYRDVEVNVDVCTSVSYTYPGDVGIARSILAPVG